MNKTMVLLKALRRALVSFSITLLCWLLVYSHSFGTSRDLPYTDSTSSSFSRAWKFYEEGHLDRAKREISQIIQKEATFIDSEKGSAWYLLGKIREIQSNQYHAFLIWKEGLEKLEARSLFDPYLSEAFIQSAIALEQELYYDRVTATFYRLLEKADGFRHQALLERLYAESEFLLPESQKERITEALHSTQPETHPGRLLREFWRSQDPTPASLVNERLIEHLQRVRYARQNFPCQNHRGFDDRGMIYVRLGPPKRTASANTGVHSRFKPHWVWAYDPIAKGLYFPFVDFGKGKCYELVESIERAIPRGLGLEERIYFYKEIGKATPVLYQRWDEALNVYRDNPNPSSAKVKLLRELSIIDENEKEYRRKVTPPSRTEVLGNVEELPLLVRTARFREPNGDTRFEMYFGISQKDFRVKYIEEFLPLDTLELRLAISVEDPTFWPDTTQKQMLAQLVELEQLEDDTLLFQTAVRTSKENFYVSGQIETWLSNPERAYNPKHFFSLRTAWQQEPTNPELLLKIGGFRSQLQKALRAESKGLLLSDLQLSRKIEFDPARGDPKKNGLYIEPFPFQKVNRLKPVYLYFEIYGLRMSEEGRSLHKIAYEADVLEPQRSFLGSVKSILGLQTRKKIELETEYSSPTPNAKEWIALDLKGLIPGKVRITVNVTDLISGESAKRSVEFDLYELPSPK